MNDGIDTTRVPVVQITETGEAMADSRDVAAYFGKEHKNVLLDIRNLNCSDKFRRLNFEPFKNKDLTGADARKGGGIFKGQRNGRSECDRNAALLRNDAKGQKEISFG